MSANIASTIMRNIKGEIIMKKRYVVYMTTKKLGFTMEVRSLRTAKRLMNLKLWKYAKIHDIEDYSCIDFIKR